LSRTEATGAAGTSPGLLRSRPTTPRWWKCCDALRSWLLRPVRGRSFWTGSDSNATRDRGFGRVARSARDHRWPYGSLRSLARTRPRRESV
jgi:hypothetical protein